MPDRDGDQARTDAGTDRCPNGPTANDPPDFYDPMTEQRFRQFYESTYARLWAYVARIGGDRHLADDVVQEAYIRLLRAPRLPDADGELRSLLHTIAINVLRDHWRRTKRMGEWTDEIADRSADTADEHPRDDSPAHDVASALEQLPARQRSLLWLAYVEGYEHREIAAMMSLGEKSIKVLLFRARKRLADILHRMGAVREVNDDRT